MEPDLALNYPVPMFDELLGFFGSGSEPGSIPTYYRQKVKTGPDSTKSNK